MQIWNRNVEKYLSPPKTHLWFRFGVRLKYFHQPKLKDNEFKKFKKFKKNVWPYERDGIQSKHETVNSESNQLIG